MVFKFKSSYCLDLRNQEKMNKESFEMLNIEEKVETINKLGGLKKTEDEIGINAKTVGKALKRAKYKYNRKDKLYKNKDYSEVERSQTKAMDIDELSGEMLKVSEGINEISSKKLINAIKMEENNDQKLIKDINKNEGEINLILKNIKELKEMFNNHIYKEASNNRQQSKNIKLSLKSLPQTIETLERTFKINLEVAENFDEFYEENNEFRVQDLINLALQELIDKYK